MTSTLSTPSPTSKSRRAEPTPRAAADLRQRPARPLTPAAMHLRSLRYFHELLVTGYRCARHPDPFPRALRGERIALGIDVVELDTIPLWSMGRPDGAVAIPMAGLILEMFDRCVEDFCGALGLDARSEPEELREDRLALRRLLETIPQADEDDDRACRADTYIPGERMRRLCGRDGLLERILARCESCLRTAPRDP